MEEGNQLCLHSYTMLIPSFIVELKLPLQVLIDISLKKLSIKLTPTCAAAVRHSWLVVVLGGWGWVGFFFEENTLLLPSFQVVSCIQDHKKFYPF